MSEVKVPVKKTELMMGVASGAAVAAGVLNPAVAALSTGSYMIARTMDKVTGQTTDGTNTTEFWISNAVQLAAVLLPALGIPFEASVVIAGLNALYNVGRGIYKLFKKGKK